MARIKLSYSKIQTLRTVLRLLRPIVKSYKVSKNDTGRYKKAYIEIEE